MSDRTYSTDKSFFDDNVDTNNNNEITGEDLNDALTYLLQGLAGKLFDETKPYKTGQLVLKEDATWGFEIWKADSDLSDGSWNASNFTRISTRKAAWDTWTPTLSWTGGTPGSPSVTVARYTRVEKTIHFYIHIEGSNDAGTTLTALNITLPVTPKDVNAYVPIHCLYDSGNKAMPDDRLGAAIDAKDNTAANRKLYTASGYFSVANAADYIFIFEGFYEVE